MSPTTGMVAPVLTAAAREAGETNTGLSVQVMKYVFLANLLGNPGIAIPIGHDAATTLPVSLHLMGQHWQDHVLLRVAHTLETLFAQRQVPAAHHDLLAAVKKAAAK
jgi:Asp-tRNA(Asn)/Glu-tRNA(Gln) amidotransferase A subunit family amidase